MGETGKLYRGGKMIVFVFCGRCFIIQNWPQGTFGKLKVTSTVIIRIRVRTYFYFCLKRPSFQNCLESSNYFLPSDTNVFTFS